MNQHHMQMTGTIVIGAVTLFLLFGFSSYTDPMGDLLK